MVSPRFFVIERRKGFGFFEDGPVVVVDAEMERVVAHHSEHDAITEYAGLAEHAAESDIAERRKLLAQ
jgi:hypothetical protein